MRIELEQVATHQDVEREMKVLTKHQTKLRELKCAVAKVTARFNAQNSDDDTSNTEMLQLASSLSSIEQKLAVQVYERPSFFLDWNFESYTMLIAVLCRSITLKNVYHFTAYGIQLVELFCYFVDQ